MFPALLRMRQFLAISLAFCLLVDPVWARRGAPFQVANPSSLTLTTTQALATRAATGVHMLAGRWNVASLWPRYTASPRAVPSGWESVFIPGLYLVLLQFMSHGPALILASVGGVAALHRFRQSPSQWVARIVGACLINLVAMGWVLWCPVGSVVLFASFMLGDAVHIFWNEMMLVIGHPEWMLNAYDDANPEAEKTSQTSPRNEPSQPAGLVAPASQPKLPSAHFLDALTLYEVMPVFIPDSYWDFLSDGLISMPPSFYPSLKESFDALNERVNLMRKKESWEALTNLERRELMAAVKHYRDDLMRQTRQLALQIIDWHEETVLGTSFEMREAPRSVMDLNNLKTLKKARSQLDAPDLRMDLELTALNTLLNLYPYFSRTIKEDPRLSKANFQILENARKQLRHIDSALSQLVELDPFARHVRLGGERSKSRYIGFVNPQGVRFVATRRPSIFRNLKTGELVHISKLLGHRHMQYLEMNPWELDQSPDFFDEGTVFSLDYVESAGPRGKQTQFAYESPVYEQKLEKNVSDRSRAVWGSAARAQTASNQWQIPAHETVLTSDPEMVEWLALQGLHVVFLHMGSKEPLRKLSAQLETVYGLIRGKGGAVTVLEGRLSEAKVQRFLERLPFGYVVDIAGRFSAEDVASLLGPYRTSLHVFRPRTSARMPFEAMLKEHSVVFRNDETQEIDFPSLKNIVSGGLHYSVSRAPALGPQGNWLINPKNLKVDDLSPDDPERSLRKVRAARETLRRDRFQRAARYAREEMKQEPLSLHHAAMLFVYLFGLPASTNEALVPLIHDLEEPLSPLLELVNRIMGSKEAALDAADQIFKTIAVDQIFKNAKNLPQYNGVVQGHHRFALLVVNHFLARNGLHPIDFRTSKEYTSVHDELERSKKEARIFRWLLSARAVFGFLIPVVWISVLYALSGSLDGVMEHGASMAGLIGMGHLPETKPDKENAGPLAALSALLAADFYRDLRRLPDPRADASLERAEEQFEKSNPVLHANQSQIVCEAYQDVKFALSGLQTGQAYRVHTQRFPIYGRVIFLEREGEALAFHADASHSKVQSLKPSRILELPKIFTGRSLDSSVAAAQRAANKERWTAFVRRSVALYWPDVRTEFARDLVEFHKSNPVISTVKGLLTIKPWEQYPIDFQDDMRRRVEVPGQGTQMAEAQYGLILDPSGPVVVLVGDLSHAPEKITGDSLPWNTVSVYSLSGYRKQVTSGKSAPTIPKAQRFLSLKEAQRYVIRLKQDLPKPTLPTLMDTEAIRTRLGKNSRALLAIFGNRDDLRAKAITEGISPSLFMDRFAYVTRDPKELRGIFDEFLIFGVMRRSSANKDLYMLTERGAEVAANIVLRKTNEAVGKIWKPYIIPWVAIGLMSFWRLVTPAVAGVTPYQRVYAAA